MDEDGSLGALEPETREAAKIAARKAGLAVEDWLNRAVMKQAVADLAGRANGRDAQLPALPTEALMQTLEKLADDIRRENRLLGERTERAASEAMQPVQRSVEQLSVRLEQLGESAAGKADRAALAVAPLERTMLKLSERLEQVERPPRRGLLGRLFGG